MIDIPTPNELKELYPLSEELSSNIEEYRKTAKQICAKKTDKIAIILGPCSIHDLASTMVYGRLLKKLSEKVKKHFFLVMRVFTEKPRTQAGWKGLLYDPYLDGSCDIVTGLRWTRKLLLDLTEIGIPCAREFVDPVLAPYFNDLTSWGLIGARTSASQPHRQMASNLPFPIGFKNATNGDITPALQGIKTALCPHTYMHLADKGSLVRCTSMGNPDTHLVLRGSDTEKNFDPDSVKTVIEQLKAFDLNSQFLIDCSHGNSQKKHELQAIAFRSAIQQIAQHTDSICGMMLESHLFEGKQDLTSLDSLKYGISITDPCISWKTTEKLILEGYQTLEKLTLSKADVPKIPKHLHLS